MPSLKNQGTKGNYFPGSLDCWHSTPSRKEKKTNETKHYFKEEEKPMSVMDHRQFSHHQTSQFIRSCGKCSQRVRNELLVYLVFHSQQRQQATMTFFREEVLAVGYQDDSFAPLPPQQNYHIFLMNCLIGSLRAVLKGRTHTIQDVLLLRISQSYIAIRAKPHSQGVSSACYLLSNHTFSLANWSSSVQDNWRFIILL